MGVSKELNAASATMMILLILQSGDSYGYAIIQRVREVSRNAISWTDGMLYPILHRLEAVGFVRSFWRQAETGRKRKYYAITDEGRVDLMQLQNQWDLVQGAIEVLRTGVDEEDSHV